MERIWKYELKETDVMLTKSAQKGCFTTRFCRVRTEHKRKRTRVSKNTEFERRLNESDVDKGDWCEGARKLS